MGNQPESSNPPWLQPQFLPDFPPMWRGSISQINSLLPQVGFVQCLLGQQNHVEKRSQAPKMNAQAGCSIHLLPGNFPRFTVSRRCHVSNLGKSRDVMSIYLLVWSTDEQYQAVGQCQAQGTRNSHFKYHLSPLQAFCTLVNWTSADVPKSRASLSPMPALGSFSAPLHWCREWILQVLDPTSPCNLRHFASGLWAPALSS